MVVCGPPITLRVFVEKCEYRFTTRSDLAGTTHASVLGWPNAIYYEARLDENGMQDASPHFCWAFQFCLTKMTVSFSEICATVRQSDVEGVNDTCHLNYWAVQSQFGSVRRFYQRVRILPYERRTGLFPARRVWFDLVGSISTCGNSL
jgi:hypothetical protein